MYILGIYTGHNATAALLKDGKVIACASEERFRNKKNYSDFPQKSIDFVLSEAGIRKDDLSYVALPARYGIPIHATKGAKDKSAIIKFFDLIYRPIGFFRGFYGLLAYYLPFLRRLSEPVSGEIFKIVGSMNIREERKFMAQYFGLPLDRVKSYDHHLAHAASAYYCSPFNRQRTLVLTLDGEGDLLCATVNVFNKDHFRRIAYTYHTHSLGWVYSELTKFFGMKSNEHEFKIMGLAPYAKSWAVDQVFAEIKDLVTLDSKNKLTFTSSIDTRQTMRFLKENLVARYRFDNIAGAFQRLVEERVAEWVKEAIKETGIKNVACAGGVFMNVKVNQKIAEIKEIEQFFVMPSASDESTAIGAAILAYREAQKEGKSPLNYGNLAIKDLYWGPRYREEEIEEILKKLGCFERYNVEKVERIDLRIADLLARGEIVARLAGKMEWGARALGNRSILANPSNPQIVRELNERVKNRDFWMPFTPSILEECSADYFENPKGIFAPYMVITFNSTSRARRELAATLHPYDFTLRPQVVRRDWNPEYYRIIEEFKKRTGIGGVLNTSFNLHGYPIVKGPREALWVFENSGLRYLALENFLVTKKA